MRNAWIKHTQAESACKGAHTIEMAHTLFTGQRRREREREKEGGRERGLIFMLARVCTPSSPVRERLRERERGRERKREIELSLIHI